jgi:hypothetical protein
MLAAHRSRLNDGSKHFTAIVRHEISHALPQFIHLIDSCRHQFAGSFLFLLLFFSLPFSLLLFLLLAFALLVALLVLLPVLLHFRVVLFGVTGSGALSIDATAA